LLGHLSGKHLSGLLLKKIHQKRSGNKFGQTDQVWKSSGVRFGWFVTRNSKLYIQKIKIMNYRKYIQESGVTKQAVQSRYSKIYPGEPFRIDNEVSGLFLQTFPLTNLPTTKRAASPTTKARTVVAPIVAVELPTTTEQTTTQPTTAKANWFVLPDRANLLDLILYGDLAFFAFGSVMVVWGIHAIFPVAVICAFYLYAIQTVRGNGERWQKDTVKFLQAFVSMGICYVHFQTFNIWTPEMYYENIVFSIAVSSICYTSIFLRDNN
jgi:hypothetical protein